MNTIKILGVDGHRETALLQRNVQRALRNLNLRLVTEVVDDVSKLMESKISGIPALIVRGQVVSQRDVPPVADLQLLFQSVFLSKKIKLAMKNILVPTDFSPTAHTAFEYAKALARRNGANLKLVNVHYPNVGAVDANSADLFTEGLEYKQRELDKFARQDPALVSPQGDLLAATAVEKEVMIGFPAEAIVEHTEGGSVDLVVMGKTGENGFLDKVFGSISADVARRAHCPVLLVPNGALYSRIQRILYATDHHSADEVMMEEVATLVGNELADIHFVHINRTPTVEYHLADLHFENGLAKRFHVANVEGPDVMDGINRYASENRIDLIVIATSHRPFFEALFHKSLTKRLAMNTELPLLVMHFDD